MVRWLAETNVTEVVGSCPVQGAAFFSWKRFHILQNTIDVVIKIGLWLRLPIGIIPYIKLKSLSMMSRKICNRHMAMFIIMINFV